MLINEVDLSLLLQDDWRDHDSEFNWKKGTRIFNKTSYFVLPMIGMSVDGNICSRYLRNAYLDDKGIEHDFIRPVFMLFRVRNQKEKFWTDFCNAAQTRSTYLTDYYVGQDSDSALIMYVFQVPDKMADDYKYFKAGQYTKMSDQYKKGFEQYIFSPSGDKRESRIWGILNKSETLKDEVVKRFIVPTTSTPDDVVSLRRDMNKWDEIWDAPHENTEVYHCNYANANTTSGTADVVQTYQGNDSTTDSRQISAF